MENTLLCKGRSKNSEKKVGKRIISSKESYRKKNKRYGSLRQRDSVNTDSIAGLSDQLAMVMQDIEDIKRTGIALQSVSEPSDD